MLKNLYFIICRYIIVADDFSICRMRLDGSKLLRLELPGLPTKLTLDYENHYLHYISSHDNSVYRIDYQHFDSRTRPQKLFSLSKVGIDMMKTEEVMFHISACFYNY